MNTERLYNILLVDDSESDRATYRRYLLADEGFDYQIIEAESLPEGLELWRSQQPDIVLIAINLPDGNSLAFLEAIRISIDRLINKLPVILLTEEGDERIALRAMKLGAADYLIKDDITSVSLLTCIAQVQEDDLRLKQLRRSQQQQIQLQSQMLDQIHDAVISTTLDGTILTWNLGAERLYEYEPNEAIGQSVSMLYLQEDLFLMESTVFRPLLEKGTHETELRNQTKSGKIIYISLRLSLVRDAMGNPLRLIGCSNDISDRKQAEEKLQKIPDRLTIALKSGAIGSWEWDLVNNIGIWDERMFELYGVDKKSNSLTECEILANALHPDDRNSVETLLQQAILGEAEYDTEFRIVHSDSSIHFIKAYGVVVRDAQGNPQRMIGVNFDISDRKEAEQALKESQQFLQTVLDSFPLAVFWKNRESVILGCNQRFAQMSELASPEAVVGKTTLDFSYSEAEVQSYIIDDQQVMRSGIPKFAIEETITLSTGET